MADALDKAGQAIAASKPDTLVVYSTQWMAVLDQLWQTRPRLKDIHVDENWHEYGDLPFDITTDVELAEACVTATNDAGVKTKGVDYDKFPIDTGSIVTTNFLDPDNKYKMVISANNLYHDWKMTEQLGRIAAEKADKLGRKIAVIGCGGLSGSFFRNTINITEDHIASEVDDEWNRKILALIEAGDVTGLLEQVPDYAATAKVDMGFKHMAFILGALGNQYSSATVHNYGPLYGSGGAVVEFNPN
jgi:2-aminophenol/2-amino-5-chlorophenol 1,6-dioxygenase alpha subunit